MSKFKFAVFVIILAVSLSIIIYPYIDKSDLKGKPPEEITLESGDYIVGEDIHQGMYDIEVISGKVQFMQRELSEKEKVLGMKLNNREHVIIQGKGKVNLTPAKFEALKRDQSGHYKIDHSGYYKVGSQIPEGEYNLSYVGETETEKPFIQILSSNRDVQNTYDFSDKNEYKIRLKKGNILEINKFLFFESDHIVIYLTPLK